MSDTPHTCAYCKWSRPTNSLNPHSLYCGWVDKQKMPFYFMKESAYVWNVNGGTCQAWEEKSE